jgi:hypothetical protein
MDEQDFIDRESPGSEELKATLAAAIAATPLKSLAVHVAEDPLVALWLKVAKAAYGLGREDALLEVCENGL